MTINIAALFQQYEVNAEVLGNKDRTTANSFTQEERIAEAVKLKPALLAHIASGGTKTAFTQAVEDYAKSLDDGKYTISRASFGLWIDGKKQGLNKSNQPTMKQANTTALTQATQLLINEGWQKIPEGSVVFNAAQVALFEAMQKMLTPEQVANAREVVKDVLQAKAEAEQKAAEEALRAEYDLKLKEMLQRKGEELSAEIESTVSALDAILPPVEAVEIPAIPEALKQSVETSGKKAK